jgi:hypothetical protein
MQLDLESEQVPLTSHGETIHVHKGFLTIYEGFRDQIRYLNLQRKNVYITGISLEGALSSLSALDLYQYNPKIYTFGSPKVFDRQGAELVNELVPNIYRIYNTAVIYFLNNLNYSHVSKSIPFTINMESAIKNHTKAYQEYYKDVTNRKEI